MKGVSSKIGFLLLTLVPSLLLLHSPNQPESAQEPARKARKKLAKSPRLEKPEASEPEARKARKNTARTSTI